MHITKFILSTAIIGLSLNYANAQSINLTPINLNDCHCFPQKVIGMEDNAQQSAARGFKTGASVQYVLGDRAIHEAKLEEEALVNILNNYSNYITIYFKDHSNLKGIFAINLTVYPHYKTPYQFDVKNTKNAQELLKIKELNHLIASHSECNLAGYCSGMIFDVPKFSNPEIADIKWDIDEFNKYSAKQFTFGNTLSTTNDKKLSLPVVYAHNLQYNQPIPVMLIMGTNGYVVTPEKAKAFLRK
jgi:hypothetical protein